MEFQITQNYKDGCKGFLYFNIVGVPHRDMLERVAIKKAKEDWESINPSLYFSEPERPRPTIEVAEYEDGKKVKNGISFKTKWR